MNDTPENTQGDDNQSSNQTYNNNEPNLRRVGRASRKESLPPSPPLFPPDENDDDNASDDAYERFKPPIESKPQQSSTQAANDEQVASEKQVEDNIDLPPPDFSLLSHDEMSDVEELARSTGAVRAVKVTPQSERYPPLPNQIDAIPEPVAAPKPPPRTGASPRAMKPTTKPQTRRGLYNGITIIATLATLALCVFYSLIWIEPQSLLNPFPPEVEYVYITATFPANEAPIATPLPSDANGIDGTGVTSLYPFTLTADGILHIPNGNGRACEWSSIAGSVLDANGSPLNGYRIRISDSDGNTDTVFTGATLTFGEGGFEYPIANAPIANDYSVQLFSPQDAPLSDNIAVSTRATCEENVTVVIFQSQ